jgi:hypothetical protein
LFLSANAVIFLSHSSPVCSCLFCFCDTSLPFLRLIVFFCLLFSCHCNQNPTSGLRNLISGVCNICVRVTCALSPLQTHFKFCIRQRSLVKLLL